MGRTDILTCVFALYGTDGHFNTAFLPYMGPFFLYKGPTDILTCVFALYGTGTYMGPTDMGPTDILTCVFDILTCLIWDRRTY